MNRLILMNFLKRFRKQKYKILHYFFGCPENDLTQDYIVRVCIGCSRFRFANKEAEALFKSTGHKF